jgi:hypothetical protein
MPDPNAKYVGAWQEISARIQARDKILLSFIALAATLVGISLSRTDLAFTVVGVGYAALASALLERHHDLMMSYLGYFQKAIAESDGLGKGTPEWRSSAFVHQAFGARLMRDFAQLLVIGFGAVPGLYIAKKTIAPGWSYRAFLWYGSLACSLAAFAVVVQTIRDRRRLLEKESSVQGPHDPARHSIWRSS